MAPCFTDRAPSSSGSWHRAWVGHVLDPDHGVDAAGLVTGSIVCVVDLAHVQCLRRYSAKKSQAFLNRSPSFWLLDGSRPSCEVHLPWADSAHVWK